MRNLISKSRLFKFLTRLGRDKRGVSAVAFAISFAVLTPMALGVFDVYQATEQRGKLQDALDAAALYAAKSSAVTTADINTAGQKALTANLQLIHGATLTSSSFTLSCDQRDGSTEMHTWCSPPSTSAYGPTSRPGKSKKASRLPLPMSKKKCVEPA